MEWSRHADTKDEVLSRDVVSAAVIRTLDEQSRWWVIAIVRDSIDRCRIMATVASVSFSHTQPYHAVPRHA